MKVDSADGSEYSEGEEEGDILKIKVDDGVDNCVGCGLV